jgi:putative membrane protein
MISLCAIAYYVDIYLTPQIHIPTMVTTLMGTAMAFFIAFNNNQAYSRWWEARIIWGGIVNDSRSWARSLLAYTTDDESKTVLVRSMVLRHIGFLYALKTSLRKVHDDEYKKFLSEEEAIKVKSFANIPNAILDLQANDIQLLSDYELIDGFRFMQINGLLQNFCDHMGKSERINNTVFPTNYIYFTRLFIWILVVFVTVTSAENVGPWSILLGWVLGFVFHTTHINGMAIMNPFEIAPECVPLSSITRNIEINLLQMLGETKIPAPEPTMHDGEYIL